MYPTSLVATGIRVGYSIDKDVILYLQSSKESVSGTDNLNFYSGLILTNDWDFDVTDIGMGVGYIKDNFCFNNTKAIFSVIVSNYSVKNNVQLITNINSNKSNVSYSGSTTAVDLNWLNKCFFNTSRNVSLDFNLGYKMADVGKLGDYSDTLTFNFTGIKYGLGLSYLF